MVPHRPMGIGRHDRGDIMKKVVLTALGAALLLVSAASAQDQAPITAAIATPLLVKKADVGSSLPSNSEVWISLDRPVDSKTLKMGDKFDVTVSRDVMIGDYIVIPRGTHGHGQISYRTGKGAFGKSAKMEFDITDVTLGDRSIPLAGHYRIEGQGNTGAAVGAVGAVVAVGVFGAFVTGHSAMANQGSEWKAATKEPILVAIAPASDAPVMAAAAPAAPAAPQASYASGVAAGKAALIDAPTGGTLTPAVATVVKN